MTCLFGHSWELWSKPEIREFTERLLGADGSLGEWKPRNLTVQDRRCLLCGLYEIRRVHIQ